MTSPVSAGPLRLVTQCLLEHKSIFLYETQLPLSLLLYRAGRRRRSVLL